MTEDKLWIKRHEIVTALKNQLTEEQMNLVNQLVDIDLQIERNE